MANAWTESKEIAKRSLKILAQQSFVLPYVYMGKHEAAIKQKGDTMQVRRPQTTETVDGSVSISGAYKDIDTSPVDVVLAYQRCVPVILTSQEMTYNMSQFETFVVTPAIRAIASYIDSSILGLYKGIPGYYGTSGVTPDALSDLSQTRKILQDNNVPLDERAFIINSDAEAELLELDSFVAQNKSGTGETLRKGIIGDAYGCSIVHDPQVAVHTAGTFTAVTTPLTAGSTSAGATSIDMDGGVGTETIKEGDIFSIDNVQYCATADATATGGAITVAVYPAVPTTIADNTAITFPDKNSGGHVANLLIQKEAIMLSMANLAPAIAGAKSEYVDYKGISIRVTSGFDINTDKNIIRFDVLFGIKLLQPKSAARLLG